jgi:hypothetical protein
MTTHAAIVNLTLQTACSYYPQAGNKAKAKPEAGFADLSTFFALWRTNHRIMVLLLLIL